VLANLSNCDESHHELILHHPQLLSSLRTILAEGKPDARRPAMSCIMALVKANRKAARKALAESGIVGTLRCICEWSGNGGGGGGVTGTGAGAGGGGGARGYLGRITEDSDVEQAKMVYEWLEHETAF
jgi:hypothetical protein